MDKSDSGPSTSRGSGRATGEPRTQTANGVITKLEGNYGLINNALFFDTNVIKGDRPSIGDRVKYRTGFNPSAHPSLQWTVDCVEKLQSDSSGEREDTGDVRDKGQSSVVTGHVTSVGKDGGWVDDRIRYKNKAIRGGTLKDGDRVKMEYEGDEIIRIARAPSSSSASGSGGDGSDNRDSFPSSRKRTIPQEKKDHEVIDLCSPPRKKNAAVAVAVDDNTPSSSSSPPPPSSPPSPSSPPHPPSPTRDARRPNNLPFLPVHCPVPHCTFVNKKKEKKEYRNLHSALNHAWEMHGGWSLTKEQLKATCTVCSLPCPDCTNTEEVLTHLKKCRCHFIIGPK